MSTESLLVDVWRERDRQMEKFGAAEHGLSREKLLAVLTEEYLEVVREVKDGGSWERLRAELIQVAAVAVKFVSVRDEVERG